MILTNRVLVKKDKLNMKQVKNVYERHLYKEAGCKNCDYLPERHTETCNDCANFIGHFKLWRKSDRKKGWIELPRGNYKSLRKCGVDPTKLKDKTTFQKLKVFREIEWNEEMPLWEHQSRATDAVIASDRPRGVIQSKARTGKTVIGSNIVLHYGNKTLILANQDDLLNQMYKTLMGFTNIGDVEKFKGKTLVKMCKTYKDFKSTTICLATYQTFLSSRGRKMLKKIKDMFGVVLVDECFPYDTDVIMADGSFKSIGDIVASNLVGESVLSFNTRTGNFEPNKIISTLKKSVETEKLVRITFEDGTSQICTENHRWWSKTRGDWVKAKSLMETDDIESYCTVPETSTPSA